MKTVARRKFGALSLAPLLGGWIGCDAPNTEHLERELIVFAASSLREVFTELSHRFTAQHPEVRVAFNFAGTGELKAQLEHSTSGDVFAGADRGHTEALVRAGICQGLVVFARNEPCMIVPLEPRSPLTNFLELPNATRIVVGAPEVPIGRYTDQILERANKVLGHEFQSRVLVKVVSRELNVKQVLAKVSLGEADAGVVYRTDALLAQNRVRILNIPAEFNVFAEYTLAILTKAKNPTLARDWVALIRSRAGQSLFARFGFLPPTETKP